MTRAHRYGLGLVVLLSLFFLQAALASPRNSVTFDEQYHVTLGTSYLKTGDLRLHRNQSPPLFEIITSLPLLLRSDLNLPLDHPAYALWGDVYLFSDVFLWHANADAQGIVHTGRLVAAGFGVLLGLLLYLWGKQLYGAKAGLLAAFLLALDPNFIANAIPTLDLGLAFFVTLAAWRLWHSLRRPTWLNILLAGLALGAALSTKFIAVTLLPAFALILLVYPQRATKTQRDEENAVSRWLRGEIARRALSFAVMLVIAWLVIWAVYAFQLGPIDGVGPPVPAPMYFESFAGMLAQSSQGRMNYLDGELSLAGWPHYFVAATLYKTPLPVLLVTLVALIRWPWRSEWRETSILIVPAALFFVAASFGNLQLGYRYILPVLPFVYLVASRVATFTWPRWVVVPAAALAMWLIAGTLSIFPHYLSYFNEVAGGPQAGYQHLVDSNLDWGQDLPALKDWIDARRPENLHLGFFGTAYPDRYGVHAIGIPGYPLNAFGNEVDGFTSYSLEAGLYAVSATALRIGMVFDHFNIYEAFESMAPIDRAGYSILIYDVRYPPGADVDRAVIAGPRAADVPPQALGVRPGHPLRAKWCAWPECFVFTPHPARYVVRDFIPFAPDLAEQARARAVPVDTLRLGDDTYVVSELDATAIIQRKLSALRASAFAVPRHGDAVLRHGDAMPATPPIAFDNGLSLVGYEVSSDRAPRHGDAVPAGQALDVITYWQVTDRVSPPMTIFVHLLDSQGDIRGQHDGFGAALTTLEPGDVVAQHHVIPVDASVEPGTYRLQVGLYNPVTLERFAARSGEAAPSDRVLLSTVEVVAP